MAKYIYHYHAKHTSGVNIIGADGIAIMDKKIVGFTTYTELRRLISLRLDVDPEILSIQSLSLIATTD